MNDSYNQPLRVVRLIATRPRDPERGPRVWMRQEDASSRLLVDGELVWVFSPRRRELATLGIDDTLPRGDIVLRDIVGASPSEDVKIVKVNTDEPPRRGVLA